MRKLIEDSRQIPSGWRKDLSASDPEPGLPRGRETDGDAKTAVDDIHSRSQSRGVIRQP